MHHPPTILVIFGATGDLVRKKIVPALWHLYEEQKFPSDFFIVGVSRRDLTQDAFRNYMAATLAAYRDDGAPDRRQAAFLKLFTYVQGLFETKEAYVRLGEALHKIERRYGICANKLFYLAVTPDANETVLTRLARSGVSAECAGSSGWTRIIVEKPFGKDADTAQRLDELLGELFREEQIYRIDHYLAKEMIRNILAFRFSNNLFEKNWGQETIERIDIRLWERIGVEERGAFYDGVGALRDVGQNHLLQMLALVTMDRPASLEAPALRRKRAEILHSLAVPSRQVIARTSVRAQYEGYRAIRGVRPDSKIETYFKIDAMFTAPRWKGVAVTLESGKRLGEQRKEVVITFRHPSPCLCPPGSGVHYRNRIVISLEPEERITIHFWSKKPGFVYDLEERTLSFLLRETGRKSQYVEEYKKLLADCITGDQTLFVSTEEVKAMWRFIDPISDAWQAGVLPLATYKPDTNEIVEEAEKAEMGRAVPQAAKRELGFIGLGKMGKGLARQLLEQQWRVIVYNRSREPVEEMAREGAHGAENLRDLVSRLPRPRLVWLMVTAGDAADAILFGKGGLARLLAKGDTVIDGGNSFYEDSVRRARKLKRHGINFLDAGVSGGPGGARNGACIMVGGEERIFRRYEELFAALSVEDGYAYVGKSGAGHFVKMVHNGIEYGMMQALAEGFAVLKRSPFALDLAKVAELYNHGSVITSRLVGWLKDGYAEYGEDLKSISGTVGHTGEGEWTVKTAEKLKVGVPIIKGAFDFRVKSKKNPSYIGKILSALRNQFGGHSINEAT